MSTRKRGELPAPPKVLRLYGTAATIEAVPAVYTEEQLLAYGRSCYAAGVADQPTEEERAERELRHHQRIADEEREYADRRGPLPRDPAGANQRRGRALK